MRGPGPRAYRTWLLWIGAPRAVTVGSTYVSTYERKDDATYFGFEVQVSMKGLRTIKRESTFQKPKLVEFRPLFFASGPFHDRKNKNICSARVLTENYIE